MRICGNDTSQAFEVTLEYQEHTGLWVVIPWRGCTILDYPYTSRSLIAARKKQQEWRGELTHAWEQEVLSFLLPESGESG
jgi:hypothetical protein